MCTCDICNEDKICDIVVLCDECGQSNQICSDCAKLDYLYCRECGGVLDIT